MKNIYKSFTLIALTAVLLSIIVNTASSQNSVSGLVKFSDNFQTVTSGTVKAYDLNGMEIASSLIQSNGSYSLQNLPPQPMDLIGLADDELEDFSPAYHPNKEDWLNAVSITPMGNITGVNIYVTRTTGPQNPYTQHIKGNITLNGKPLKDAVVYGRVNGITKISGVTDANGNYDISGASDGEYTLFVNRIGCTSTTRTVTIKGEGLDKIDFVLEKVSKPNSSIKANDFFVSQNFPNPFNPTTLISYYIPWSGNVKLTIYNSVGQVVKELVNGYKESGSYKIEFDGSALSSGVYFYKLDSKGNSITRKMTLVK
jgi:hypothetical protein